MEKTKMTFKQAIQKYGKDVYDNMCFDNDYQNKEIVNRGLINALTTSADELNVEVTETEDYIEVSFSSDEVEEILDLTEEEDCLGYTYRLDVRGNKVYLKEEDPSPEYDGYNDY